MNKKFLLLSLLTLLNLPVLLACGPESMNREFSLFLKTHNRSSPFYYFYFNGNSYDFGDYSNNQNPKQTPNELEWVKLLENRFRSKQIQNFIKRPENEAVGSNDRKIYDFLKTRKPDVLAYINQLWKYEDYTKKYYGKWHYKSYANPENLTVLLNNINETKKIYKKTKNINLKWRCAYHMVRTAYFHQQIDVAEKLYQEFVEPLPKNTSIMELWCLGIKGGILKKRGRKEESFLHFAKRFVQDTTSFQQVYIDLKNLKNIDLNKVMPFCKSDADRLSVIVAKSVNTSSFTMQAVRLGETHLKDDANLQFVYQRELQKLEADYIRGKLMTADSEKRTAFDENLQMPQAIQFQTLFDFTKRKATQPGASAYWQNALAYLNIVQKDFVRAKKQLNYARINVRKKSLDVAQTKMLEFLSVAIEGGKIETQELANYILDFHNNKVLARDDRNSLSIFSYNYILPKLIEQGNLTEALIVASLRDVSLPDRYNYNEEKTTNYKVDLLQSNQFVKYYLNYVLNEEQFVKTIQNIVQGKNSFANRLKRSFRFKYDAGDYNRFLVYKRVRQQNYTGALALQAKTTGFALIKFAKPFEMHYDDVRSPHAVDSAQGFLTAKEYLQLGEKLKIAAKKRNGAARFRYGQYLYHLTYYGYNRHLMDENSYEYRSFNTPVYNDYNKIQTEEWYYWFHRRFDVTLDEKGLSYYDCSTAMSAFKSALKVAKNNEQKAKINFMLARCYQKNAPLPKLKKDEKYGWSTPQPIVYKGKKYFSYSFHSFTNPYFRELKSNYSTTETYKEAFEECSYLRMFLD